MNIVTVISGIVSVDYELSELCLYMYYGDDTSMKFIFQMFTLSKCMTGKTKLIIIVLLAEMFHLINIG